MSELESEIWLLAKLRDTAETEKKVLFDARRKWEFENEDLINAQEMAALSVKAQEDVVRRLTLLAYAESQNKAPAKGVAIRTIERLEYDPEKAFDWAKAHDMALALDVKAFEKIAKASPLEIVKINSVPTATIATDLSFALEVK